jgi:hypothetical protein
MLGAESWTTVRGEKGATGATDGKDETGGSKLVDLVYFVQ